MTDLHLQPRPELHQSCLSLYAFLAGSVLLVSGATPGLPRRLAWLGSMVPRDRGGPIVGVGLLILSRRLHRRLDLAYPLIVLALVLGIGASLLKGGDYRRR